MYSKFYDKDGKLKPKGEVEDTKKETPTAETATPTQTDSKPTTPAESTTPTAMAESDTTSSLGSKLSQLTGENIDTKMIDDILPQAQNMLNSVSSTMNNVTQPSNNKVPHVRNQEETFQRLIYINTRVV